MRLLLIALAVLLAFAPATSGHAGPTPTARVLFVGNSLTYYGNVPAVFAALSTRQGHPTTSDMIVRGGATLAQRVADGSIAHALARRRYDVLVLQERGGDLIGSFAAPACTASRAAIVDAAALARSRGVRVLLLGTYQGNPSASRAIVEREQAAADEAGIGYVAVSEQLRRLVDTARGPGWFAVDGMHPGPDLALLDAMLLYDALHGALPHAMDLRVNAPIYGADSGLDARLRAADAPAPHASTPGQVRYSRERMQTLLARLADPTTGRPQWPARREPAGLAPRPPSLPCTEAP